MKWFILLLCLFFTAFAVYPAIARDQEISMIDIEKTVERLQDHLKTLTKTIGERSVFLPENLKRTEKYIETFYQDINIPVYCEPYKYRNYTVANVVAEVSFC